MIISHDERIRVDRSIGPFYHYEIFDRGDKRCKLRTAEPLGERRYENWNTHRLL